MHSVAVAASSRMAADAGLEVARQGGNAVDVAVAATLVSLTTETAVASLGGGGFVTVCPPDGAEVTVDGYVEMPGRGVPSERMGEGAREVEFGYGGGTRTTIGPGSVATPGTLAALDRAWSRYGTRPWAELVGPARYWAEEGFPLTPPAHHYLAHSHEAIFGWHPETRAALHDDEGRLLDAGETVRIPDLAWSLEMIAREGAETFYGGELAERIAGHVQESGGILALEDLRAYEPLEREPLTAEVDGWEVATNPPPAIGGATLTAMLLLMNGHPLGEWSRDELARLIRVQRAVSDFRVRELDRSEDLVRDARRILEEPAYGELRRIVESPSTIHTSVVDSEGRACSISASTGYGSGVMPPGTGIFLNNCLGEQELNPRGLHTWPVGARLPSNMAPTVARAGDGSVLAVGSPGAGRITTAILQTLLNFLRLEMDLEAAVAHPRLHVELDDGRIRVAHEPGLDLEGLGVELRAFDGLSMFFGGVAAVHWRPGDGFQVASDPRRVGGTGIEDGAGR